MVPYATETSRTVKREDFPMTGHPLTLGVHAQGSVTRSIKVFGVEFQPVLSNGY